jgi:DNA-binding winged helix-turn-helix (wHTH) protein/tetratricopeptide (TPR) repeat protein
MHNQVKHLLEFGHFRIDPEQRLLLRDEQPIPLPPKAFDLLLVLTQRSGQVVIKDDLMKLLWPDTFVEESNLAQQVLQVRKALGERAQDSAYIVTVPGRGYRFAQQVRTIPATAGEELEGLILESHSRSQMEIEDAALVTTARTKPLLHFRVVVPTVLAGVAITAAVYFYTHRAPKLTTRDTVVLADFANSTGDPVFDGTLRQGLLAQLQQSPFLNLLPDQRVAQTLALMTKTKDAQLTPEVAREVCQRTASSAALDGSIAQVGTRYLLTLRATDCSSGEVFSSASAQAVDKNHVLDALGKIAAETRRKLGESLASVQKNDVPPENVTTPSLEALQAYSLGRRAEGLNQENQAASLYRHAISLDPNFASAYEGLGIYYFSNDETSQAAENMRKAYELRQHVSQHEKLGLEVMYYALVTGNCEAARKSLLLATQLYPRQSSGFTNLGTMDGFLGEYEQGLAAQQEAMRLSPAVAKNYSNLLIAYIFMNRLEDAEAVAREAKSRNLDTPFLHANLYLAEFLRHDAGAMQREAAELMGKPDAEDLVLYYQSDTAAYGGRFVQARKLTRRAQDSALRLERKETSAAYQAEAALREALVGNLASAKLQAKNALAVSNEKDVVAISAMVLGLAGDIAGATRLGDDLGKRYPEDTVVRYNFLPAIRAASSLQNDPGKAIVSLAVASPYEMGQTAQLVSLVLYPVYLRGKAYLAVKNGAGAAAEFQKILAHPGVVQNELIVPLAHLGLGRSYVLSGEAGKARVEYQNFLSLWKNADPNIPIFIQAKAEFAALQ